MGLQVLISQHNDHTTKQFQAQGVLQNRIIRNIIIQIICHAHGVEKRFEINKTVIHCSITDKT